MIQPLKIANTIYPHNLIQGPLAGVSCAPFRLLAWQGSAPAFTYTEMMSCQTVMQAKLGRYQRYIQKLPGEGPVCFQIAGHDAADISEATKLVTEYGADLIDLNCGCPAKKIRRRGAGSKLLTTPMKLYQAITAMKSNTSLPVGIKIRVQGNSDEQFNQTLVQVMKDAGVDFVTVHGRHFTENYDVPCHYDQIQFFATELNIPVIGNGDVACFASLQKMFATGCAGVMISRAGVGQPWLIRALRAAYAKQTFVLPDQVFVGKLLLQHAKLLIDLIHDEQRAIWQMRKIAKYYARRLDDKTAFCERLSCCNHYHELAALCAKFFGV